MDGVNKAILVATAGRDAEMRYSKDGSAITNVTAATNRTWKDKNSGERVQESEWHRIVFYNRLAEVAGEYIRKGTVFYVEGRLRTRKWLDKDGIDRYTTEIIAESMKLLGGRSADSQPPRPAQSGNSYAAAKEGRASNAPAGQGGFEDMDDDIPF